MALREGCAGQLAEVYDGEDPNESEGCFAQAWSTAELLRVYEALEKEKPAKKRRGRRTKRKEAVERQQAGKPEPKAEAEEKQRLRQNQRLGRKQRKKELHSLKEKKTTATWSSRLLRTDSFTAACKGRFCVIT